MADGDILVTTRYTTEGYDAALTKADRVGQSMLKLSRDIGGLGRSFNSEFLTGIGNALGGIEDMIGAVSELSKDIKAVPALGFGVAGIAGVGLGSAIYDATIGKMQQTSTAQIFDQMKQLIEAGFNRDTIIARLRIEAQTVELNNVNKQVSNLDKSALELRGYAGPKDIQGMQEALALYTAQLEKLGGVSSGIQLYSKQAIDPSLREAAAGQMRAFLEGIIHDLQLEIRKQQQVAQLQFAQAGVASYQDASDRQKKRDYDLGISQQKQAQQQQQLDLDTFTRKYNQAQAISNLEDEIATKRIAAAQSLAADLSKMDNAYYANRLQAAESFGIESARAEEDHQRQMRQLSQEHNQRLSKLADSRDALGIEDEMSNYETQRKAAEEDYSIAQSRRNQDYALQMRDMERAFQQQRQERINAYNQQLQDIAAYNTQQREMIARQFSDIASAILKAFTDAAKNLANTGTGGRSSSSTTQTMNQTNNFGSVTSPQDVAGVVHSEMIKVFQAARK